MHQPKGEVARKTKQASDYSSNQGLRAGKRQSVSQLQCKQGSKGCKTNTAALYSKLQ